MRGRFALTRWQRPLQQTCLQNYEPVFFHSSSAADVRPSEVFKSRTFRAGDGFEPPAGTFGIFFESASALVVAAFAVFFARSTSPLRYSAKRRSTSPHFPAFTWASTRSFSAGFMRPIMSV